MKKRILCVGIKNVKMGRIPSSSTVPIKDCLPGCPCYKECYALKAYRMYPNVRKGWGDNSWLARNDLPSYTQQHLIYIYQVQPKHFRFMVGGDVVSKKHFLAICSIAEMSPKTKFLLFTKRYDFVDPREIPSNLRVMLSMWPGLKYPPRKLSGLSRAYVEGCREDKRMKASYKCHKKCDECFKCWGLKGDVQFSKH